MNIKALFYFEVSKIIIGILNIIFLVEQYPQISLIISLISIITSMAVFGAVVGDVAVAVFGAGAVLGAMVVDFQEKKNQEVKPKKIKRCSKCKQEVTVWK